tara:strand:- start:21688 stop:21831 length:144 start_codon:yes stop_codon:yes gene_type:complete
VGLHLSPLLLPKLQPGKIRTNWGAAIAAQTGLSGYPSGTVNRHVFSG